MPASSTNNFAENKANAVFDHELYAVKPKHRFGSQHVTITDALPERIASGRVVVKKSIRRFSENGVLFVGDDEVCAVGLFRTRYLVAEREMSEGRRLDYNARTNGSPRGDYVGSSTSRS